jgi:hypothetical protein
MMWAGWPVDPDCLYLVTECRRMPARNRQARALAITAGESRRRLAAIGINCALAASLVALLAILAF